MQIPNSIYWKITTTLLMLGLGLSAFTSAIKVAEAAKPLRQVPCQAVSVYPLDAYPAGVPLNGLTHTVPGLVVGGGAAIGWDRHQASIQLDDYAMGIPKFSIGLVRNAANQVEFVVVAGQAGPPGGPFPWHNTDPIPVGNKPFLDLVHGCTLQIRWDNIPVYVHATYKDQSPVVGIAGHIALGDLVIYPAP